MPSSDRRARTTAIALVLASSAIGAWAPVVAAQEAAQGFAVNRLYSSAPGAGWIVMDDLTMHGGLGGAIAVSGGYARHSLRVGQGAERFAVVSDQSSADFGVAVTYQRFRFHLDFTSPLGVKGQSGTIGDRAFTGPSLDLGRSPDTLADARAGFDVRLLGEATSAFRMGLGLQLWIPSGERDDYLTDGRYRAMGRVLLASDVGRFTIAGHVGVHLRTLDDAQTPGSPRGSELLFGVAAGPRFPVGKETAVIVGPEIFGETALRAFFGDSTTGLEALLTGRLEHERISGERLRFKIGAGGGLHPQFGAPEWRMLLSIEISDHVP